MFGNSTGWMISGAVALLMGYVLYIYAVPPARTEPTNTSAFQITKTKIALPVDWKTLVTPGTKAADAAESYQKAINEYLKNTQDYESFNTRDKLTVKESDVPAVAEVFAGRECQNFNLFRKDPAKVVNYENSQPQIDALHEVGRIAATLALLDTTEAYPHKDAKRCVELAEAVVVLGGRMYDESMSWQELAAGYDLMQLGAGCLKKHYDDEKDKAQVDKFEAFVSATKEYQAKLNEAWKIIGGLQEEPSQGYPGVGIYAGDIYQLAESKTADPMFRTEAIKHIGKYQYNSISLGDQLASKKVLRILTQTPDLPPNVKVAAENARNLTIEDYHRYNGG